MTISFISRAPHKKFLFFYQRVFTFTGCINLKMKKNQPFLTSACLVLLNIPLHKQFSEQSKFFGVEYENDVVCGIFILCFDALFH